jgi:hypothetical protein
MVNKAAPVHLLFAIPVRTLVSSWILLSMILRMGQNHLYTESGLACFSIRPHDHKLRIDFSRNFDFL